MAIYKGNKKVVAVYKGSTPINKIYKGSTLVFQKSGGGGGNTHLIEGTATGNFNLYINGNSIPITPDVDGKWFYDTDEKITSLNNAFYYQSVVTSVDLSNLDLTGISTSRMFQDSNTITSIKFNNTKSMKLVDVTYMFSGCSKLVSLDLKSFDISNISDASSLFQSCSKLVSLDVSNWNTSNISNAGYLFAGCSSLVSLDLSNWDTSNLKYAISLFNSCSSLVSLDLSNFDMSNATYYNYIFAGSNKLTHIKCKQAFKDWCITHQDDIYLPTAMREGGSGTWEIIGGGSTHLIEGTATGNFDIYINDQLIPIKPDADGKWFYDTDEKITSLNSAFYDVKKVTSVDLSNLDLTGILTSNMFREASNITSIKFNNTKIIKPTNVIYMFYNCSKLVSLDLSSFDMSNATSYNGMFDNCTLLSTIKCKQAFKDWCDLNKYSIGMGNNYATINWEIVE